MHVISTKYIFKLNINRFLAQQTFLIPKYFLTGSNHLSSEAMLLLKHIWHQCILMGWSIEHWHDHPISIINPLSIMKLITFPMNMTTQWWWGPNTSRTDSRKNMTGSWFDGKCAELIQPDAYSIDIMYKFVHLPEPCLCKLVLEICSHCPHYVICTSKCSLRERKERVHVVIIWIKNCGAFFNVFFWNNF